MVAYKDDNGKNLAKSIASSVIQNKFSKSIAEEHTYVVLNASAVAVLIEAGNIKNKENAKIITSKSFIDQAINGIHNGIQMIEGKKSKTKK